MTEMVDHIVKIDGKEHIFRAPKDATPNEIEEAVNNFLTENTNGKGDTPNDFLGVAADVGKSAGIGLAQGALGLATLPANVVDLGANVIDYAGKQLGKDVGLSEYTKKLPTYSNAKEFIENRTGKFYEPKTVLGEYARTIGEFAPAGGIAGGFARGSRIANTISNTLAPAVSSETLGQLSKGTGWEPVARIAGGLAGGILPNAAMRTVTPITMDPTRQKAINLLEENGVRSLTAGQRTGNEPLRWYEASTQSTAGAGPRARRMVASQEDEFTRAALNRAGIENETRAIGPVMDDAFERLGSQFDELARNNAINGDTRLVDDLTEAWRDYSRVKGASARAPVVENTIRDVIIALKNPRNQGRFSGEAYQQLRHDLGRIQRRQAQVDPALSDAVGSIRVALDNAMERSISPQEAQQWRTIRDQYQNLLALEKASLAGGEKAAQGILSPAQVRLAAKQQNSRQASRGQRDLYELARAGEAIIKPLPSSGSPQRLMAQDLINPVAIARALAARTVMSRPVQNWLSNQALTRPIEAFENVRPTFRTALPNALAQYQSIPLRGSQQGLMLDENGNPITR